MGQDRRRRAVHGGAVVRLKPLTLPSPLRGEGFLLGRRRDEILAYESFNLVDGRTTVSEIREALAGRYAPAPLEELSEYMDLLAKAKAITWK